MRTTHVVTGFGVASSKLGGLVDDSLHLSPAGAEIYSRALAKKLAPVLEAELRGDLQSSR